MRILALVVAFMFFSLAIAVQFDVAARTERCFTEEYGQDQLVVGEYHAYPGYNMEIEVRVTSPKGVVLYRKQNADKGKYAFTTAESGDYQMCFVNTLSPGMAYSQGLKRRIQLDVKTGVDAKDYSEIAKVEHLKPIELELRKMEDTVSTIHAEMLYMRAREEAMRNTNESTNARVVWYSVLGLITSIVLGVFQVYYLKRYFHSKKLI